jgi:hypothetical protein
MAAYFYPIRGRGDLVLLRPGGQNGAVRWVRAILLIALGAAAAVSADRLVLRPAASEEVPPPVAETEPGPGDPPLVWLDGTLETIADSALALREGEGSRIQVERFAAGATKFLRQDGGQWRELSTDEVAGLEAGQQACVETLLDGQTFLALRVFLGADCGPAVEGG